MHKLYFVHSNGEWTEIAQIQSRDEVAKHISAFCDAHHYKSYYTRAWNDEQGRTWYDVGSWSEFFVLE